jgi:hypothetical protein
MKKGVSWLTVEEAMISQACREFLGVFLAVVLEGLRSLFHAAAVDSKCTKWRRLFVPMLSGWLKCLSTNTGLCLFIGNRWPSDLCLFPEFVSRTIIAKKAFDNEGRGH